MRMFIGYFLMGYLLASLKIEKMTDILRMRRFQTLMTSVRVEIRQNLWPVRFVLLRMLWSANLKARGFLFVLSLVNSGLHFYVTRLNGHVIFFCFDFKCFHTSGVQ